MKRFLSSLFLIMLFSIASKAGQAYVYAYADPQDAGYVYVGTTNSTPGTFSDAMHNASQGGFMASGDKTFYLFYSAKAGYVFKGWEKTSQKYTATTTNSTNNTTNGWSVKQTATGVGEQASYYNAIFARMILSDGQTASRSISCKVNQSTTEEVVVKHVHAGTVSATLDSEAASNGFSVAIKNGSPNSSTKDEVSTTFVITYAPSEIPANNAHHSATLTISSNNGLSPISVSLDGEAKDKQVPVFSWNVEDKPYTYNTTINNVFSTDNSATSYTINSSHPEIANIVSGNLVIYNLVGQTTITVRQEGNDDWAEREEEYVVTPVSEIGHVPFVVNNDNFNSLKSASSGTISWDNGIKIGKDEAFNWDGGSVDLHFTGVAGNVSFGYSATNEIASRVTWTIEKSADGSEWEQLDSWSNNKGTKNIPVNDASVRYIRLKYTGNYAGVFTNVTVTEGFVLNTSVSEINFSSLTTDTENAEETITLSYGNIGHIVNAVSSDANFWVSMPEFTSGRDLFGDQEIRVSYVRANQEETRNATLTISDNLEHSVTVALHATTAQAYNITFKDENGDVLQSTNVRQGELPTYEGETPTKASNAQYDFTFVGWDKEFVAVTEENVYTARFSSTPHSYTITYENVEDATHSNPDHYTFEDAIVLTEACKDGYTFDGWYDNNEFNGDAITSIAQGSTGDKTLYAKFCIHGDLKNGFAMFYNEEEVALDVDAYTAAWNITDAGVQVVLNQVPGNIPEQTPVLLHHATKDFYTFTVEPNPSVDAISPNAFVYTGTGFTQDNENYCYYVLANKNDQVAFYKFTGTIPAGKVVLVWDKSQDLGDAPMRFDLDMETDIATALVPVYESPKTFNGQIYNIYGMPVSDMSAPGFYIVNGQKYIVK